MDKMEAIKRLDALDAEAKELRKIIERGNGLKYDKWKLYVAIIGDRPYLLAGHDEANYFRWHQFAQVCTQMGWSSNHKTGQVALDDAQANGEVHEFTDRFEGMKFFYDAYMAGKK